MDECGQLAVQYQREINRSGDEEIKGRWIDKNGVEIIVKDEMDIDSFKEAVAGVKDWYIEELENQGYEDAQELVDTFTE